MNIENVNFSNASLSRSQFILSRIKSCDFSNVELHQTLFNMAKIENSDFEGASLLATNFLTTEFSKTNFDNCDFSNVKFICCFFSETTHFNSKVVNNDFSFTSFKNVSFEDTELMSGNDFKGSLFYNFKINTQSLDLNFNGCGVLDTNFVFDYCQLIDNLIVKPNVKSDIRQIKNIEDALFYNKLTFGVFTNEDIVQTKTKHDNILKEFDEIFKKRKVKKMEKE
ncbi:MAG: pentapeptide repeat-containing protein [Flavobacterium nitrogenifigens]